jgi:CBS domain-containing protein
MMVVDNKHLLMFKMPPFSDLETESAFYLTDTFYSNDPEQVDRVSEMLNDIWKRGIDISEIDSQAGTKLPNIKVETTETLAMAIDKMLANNVTSVLITENQKPMGVINDRELLKEIVNEHRDPMKTLAKEVKFTPLIVLKENESIITAMKYMGENGFSRAALVKNEQLVGMLTEKAAKKSVKPI